MSEHLDLELSAYLDGELDGAELARVEAHLEACAECREMLDDLKRLVRRAGSLDDRAPERDLWSGIAQRIVSEPTADVVPLDQHRKRRVSFTMPQLAAAAIALMALSAATGTLLLKSRGTTGSEIALQPLPTERRSDVQVINNNRIGRAVTSYEDAIEDMETALTARRGELDTSTVRILEQSLRTIDSAIAQAREALRRDPANLYLNGTLQRALDRKLGVLRQVTTLSVAS